MLEIKDKSVLLTVKFGGRGGFENEIIKLFPTLLRKDSKKLDFICKKDSIIYEAKKQQNQQWFNLSKFYNMNKNEQGIYLLFVCFDKDSKLADLIFCIEKGDFLRLLIEDEKLKDDGWSMNAIEKAYELVKIAPKIQTKASVRMRSFFKKYKKNVYIVYEK